MQLAVLAYFPASEAITFQENSILSQVSLVALIFTSDQAQETAPFFPKCALSI